MRQLFLLILLLPALLLAGAVPENIGKSNPDEDLSSFLGKAAKMITGLDINSPSSPSFSLQKKRVIRLLRRALSVSAVEEQKKYLKRVIETFRGEKFEELPVCEFIRGTTADLILAYDQEKKSITGVALKTSEEENQAAGKLFELIRTHIRKGLLGRNVSFFPEKDIIKLSDIIYPAGYGRKNIVLPSVSGETGPFPGVFILTNDIRKYFDDKIKPVSQDLFRQKTVADLKPGALIRNIYLHHLSHFTIPVMIDSPVAEKDFKGSALKDLFDTAEEIRADLNYLALISALDEKGILDKGMKDEVYYTFLLQKIVDIQMRTEETVNRPAVIILNAIYKRGGIQVDKNGKKLVADIELLSRNIKDLEAKFDDLIRNGKFDDCESFFKLYSETSENLINVIAKPPPEKSE